MSSEFTFIDWIKHQQKPSALVKLGIGDDLAALDWPVGDLLLVGVDQVLDGVHFDSSIHSPRLIGAKAMNRNLSDCAAMACLPAASLATVALPQGIGLDYARELFLGIQEAGDKFNCPIVGGDTGSWPGKLALSVSIFGRSAGIAPVSRRGAKAGDSIYVTGPLGGSIFGRHISFEPRIELARKLARAYRLTAMIDLSDGLARDLRNLCAASGVGARIESALLPIHEDVRRLTDGQGDWMHALQDGEDYELLLTSPDTIESPCVKIGVVTPGLGLSLCVDCVDRELTVDGWVHQV